MNERKYGYTELGMLLGIFVGGGVATIMFVTTGQATYFGLVGMGLALGLGLGAAFDGRRRADDERRGAGSAEQE